MLDSQVKLPPGMLALSTGLEGQSFGQGDVPMCGTDSGRQAPGGGFNFRCTLDRGHTGQHVAHDFGDHVVHEWPQDEAASAQEQHPYAPDYYDPSYPKITAWYNDIAFQVPVHPAALSKEHMQALADYEVHRRQHKRLEDELLENDEHGIPIGLPRDIQRIDNSERRLVYLRSLAEGAGHAAVGLINPYYKFARKKFYQAVRPQDVNRNLGREHRGQILPDRDAAIEHVYPGWLSAGGMKGYKEAHGGELPPEVRVEEFPGIWSLLNHRGRVTHSGIHQHPYYQYWSDPRERARILEDARNKNLTARRLSHQFGDPPEIDMSTLPIVTWGKTRKKTGEWFSNEPRNQTLELAGTETVAQDQWQEIPNRGTFAPQNQDIRTSNSDSDQDFGDEPLALADIESIEQPEWDHSAFAGPGVFSKDIDLGTHCSGHPDRMHFYGVVREPRNPAERLFMEQHQLSGPVSFGFERTDPRTGKMSSELTGGGKLGLVMTHVVNALDSLLSKHRPLGVDFIAVEDKRQKGYRQLAQYGSLVGMGNGEYKFMERNIPGYFAAVHKSALASPHYANYKTLGDEPLMSAPPKSEPASTQAAGPEAVGHGSQPPAIGAANAVNLPPGMLALGPLGGLGGWGYGGPHGPGNAAQPEAAPVAPSAPTASKPSAPPAKPSSSEPPYEPHQQEFLQRSKQQGEVFSLRNQRGHYKVSDQATADYPAGHVVEYTGGITGKPYSIGSAEAVARTLKPEDAVFHERATPKTFQKHLLLPSEQVEARIKSLQDAIRTNGEPGAPRPIKQTAGDLAYWRGIRNEQQREEDLMSEPAAEPAEPAPATPARPAPAAPKAPAARSKELEREMSFVRGRYETHDAGPAKLRRIADSLRAKGDELHAQANAAVADDIENGYEPHQREFFERAHQPGATFSLRDLGGHYQVNYYGRHPEGELFDYTTKRGVSSIEERARGLQPHEAVFTEKDTPENRSKHAQLPPEDVRARIKSIRDSIHSGDHPIKQQQLAYWKGIQEMQRKADPNRPADPRKAADYDFMQEHFPQARPAPLAAEPGRSSNPVGKHTYGPEAAQPAAQPGPADRRGDRNRLRKTFDAVLKTFPYLTPAQHEEIAKEMQAKAVAARTPAEREHYRYQDAAHRSAALHKGRMESEKQYQAVVNKYREMSREDLLKAYSQQQEIYHSLPADQRAEVVQRLHFLGGIIDQRDAVEQAKKKSLLGRMKRRLGFQAANLPPGMLALSAEKPLAGKLPASKLASSPSVKSAGSPAETSRPAESPREAFATSAIRALGEGKEIHAPEIVQALVDDRPITAQAIRKFQKDAVGKGVSQEFIGKASKFFSDFNGIRQAGNYAIIPEQAGITKQEESRAT